MPWTSATTRTAFLGAACSTRNSQITVRRFTTQKEEIDKAFFARRIEAALEYRRENTSIADAEAFRLVSSESDQVPGLIVDQYGDHLVLQALTLGIDQRKKQIVEILRELFEPKAIVERSDVPSRKLEGLEETKGVLFGETDAIVRVQFDEFSIEVNLLEDQKTGFFLDQRDNYAEVARHCAGKRVLDCFTYHGGFALAAAVADAKSVEAVEISDQAVARARKNAELNGLTGKIEFVCANAFDVLKKYDVEKRQYDVIVLDPPSFTRTKQNVGDALRGYKEINLRALKMLPPGGILATFTCSHHIDARVVQVGGARCGGRREEDGAAGEGAHPIARSSDSARDSRNGISAGPVAGGDVMTSGDANRSCEELKTAAGGDQRSAARRRRCWAGTRRRICRRVGRRRAGGRWRRWSGWRMRSSRDPADRAAARGPASRSRNRCRTIPMRRR